MNPILYVTLGIADLPRAIRFYDAALAPLGMGRKPGEPKGWGFYGDASRNDGCGIYLCPPFDGSAPTPGNGPMTALCARSAAEVRAFHAAALAHGGTDEGGPGTRAAYGPAFYVAYVRDPDGNKLACVHRHYDAATES